MCFFTRLCSWQGWSLTPHHGQLTPTSLVEPLVSVHCTASVVCLPICSEIEGMFLCSYLIRARPLPSNLVVSMRCTASFVLRYTQYMVAHTHTIIGIEWKQGIHSTTHRGCMYFRAGVLQSRDKAGGHKPREWSLRQMSSDYLIFRCDFAYRSALFALQYTIV